MNENPLGKKSNIPTQYAPGVLYPIPRWPSRSLLDIDKKLPLHGFDYWHAYELSWLNKKGRPEVGIGELFFDAKSENLVESKSLKLYLNSFNNERFIDFEELAAVIVKDLNLVTRSEVVVIIKSLSAPAAAGIDVPLGTNIDKYDIEVKAESPEAALLKAEGEKVESAQLHSNLFRSNCPITGQPDWATFMVDYSGPEIDEASLLSYVCSFRNHQSYHEECAELMFRDIMLQCHPDNLVLGLNYTRRGGIDINPFRSNNPISPEQLSFRLVRQ